MAFGTEFSHELFGKRSIGYPHEPAVVSPQLFGTPSWDTNAYSLLAEYQWQVLNPLTFFLGARADKHTYTHWLFSPRASLVYAPTDIDTIKILYNRSIRRSDDAILRRKHRDSKGKGDGEKIDSVELRYERQHSKYLWLAGSFYYSHHDVVAFVVSTTDVTNDVADIGTLELYGLEAEAIYRGEKLRLTFSHNYTKQIDFDLADVSITIQNISASAYGYGNDLANWSNNSTKLTAEYDISEKWTASGSLRGVWGYPGAKDMLRYNLVETPGPGNTISAALPIKDSTGSNRGFQESVYLNLGLEFRPTTPITLRVDDFNVLGWADNDLNKRSDFLRSSRYHREAASVGISLAYSFGSWSGAETPKPPQSREVRR